MPYSFTDWNHKQGTIPVAWRPIDYESLQWQDNHDKRGYYTDAENYEIYGKRLGLQILKYEKQDQGIFLPDEVKEKFDYVLDLFDLNNKVYSFMRYPIGHILPWHHDNYPVYRKNNNVSNIENIVRIIVFLHDSKPGQQLWIDDKLCLGTTGTWFSWRGNKEHMAANLSKEARYVLQITGTKP
jgi:hypothetical protein